MKISLKEVKEIGYMDGYSEARDCNASELYNPRDDSEGFSGRLINALGSVEARKYLGNLAITVLRTYDMGAVNGWNARIGEVRERS